MRAAALPFAALFALVGSAPACRSRTPTTPADGAGSAAVAPAPGSDAEAIAKAKAALQPFRAALGVSLTTALQRGAPAAIDVCGALAPELARQAGEKAGVRLGRASARLRSPANAAPAWVAPILDEMTKRNGGEPRLVPIAGGGRGYVEPIAVKPMCLVCHGKAVAPDVAAALDDRYPGDRARGYEAGDFRGVFWVELPPQPAVSGG